MNEESDYIIYTDGGSRGNPGEAAYGFVVYSSEKKKVYEEGKRLGIQTNNFAEYTGVIEALKWVLAKIENKTLSVKFYLDSNLAVEQLSGRWKIKNETLRSLYCTIKELERKLPAKITYSHVRREYNKEADRMVNLALDGKI